MSSPLSASPTLRSRGLTLKKLRVPPTITLFNPNFNPSNTTQSIALRYLQARNHPLAIKIRHVYKHRPRGILWWSVLHGGLQPERRRTRSVFARKARQGFVDALRRRGLDREGRPLGAPLGLGGKGGIMGTLEVYMRKEILKASQNEIERQAGEIIDVVMKNQKV